MPLCLEKAASTSSSAFFSDAAANTMMVFSCAEVGAADRRQVKTKTIINRMAFYDPPRRSLIFQNCEPGNRRSGFSGTRAAHQRLHPINPEPAVKGPKRLS